MSFTKAHLPFFAIFSLLALYYIELVDDHFRPFERDYHISFQKGKLKLENPVSAEERITFTYNEFELLFQLERQARYQVGIRFRQKSLLPVHVSLNGGVVKDVSVRLLPHEQSEASFTISPEQELTGLNHLRFYGTTLQENSLDLISIQNFRGGNKKIPEVYMLFDEGSRSLSEKFSFSAFVRLFVICFGTYFLLVWGGSSLLQLPREKSIELAVGAFLPGLLVLTLGAFSYLLIPYQLIFPKETFFFLAIFLALIVFTINLFFQCRERTLQVLATEGGWKKSLFLFSLLLFIDVLLFGKSFFSSQPTAISHTGGFLQLPSEGWDGMQERLYTRYLPHVEHYVSFFKSLPSLLWDNSQGLGVPALATTGGDLLSPVTLCKAVLFVMVNGTDWWDFEIIILFVLAFSGYFKLFRTLFNLKPLSSYAGSALCSFSGFSFGAVIEPQLLCVALFPWLLLSVTAMLHRVNARNISLAVFLGVLLLSSGELPLALLLFGFMTPVCFLFLHRKREEGETVLRSISAYLWYVVFLCLLTAPLLVSSLQLLLFGEFLSVKGGEGYGLVSCFDYFRVPSSLREYHPLFYIGVLPLFFASSAFIVFAKRDKRDDLISPLVKGALTLLILLLALFVSVPVSWGGWLVSYGKLPVLLPLLTGFLVAVGFNALERGERLNRETALFILLVILLTGGILTLYNSSNLYWVLWGTTLGFFLMLCFPSLLQYRREMMVAFLLLLCFHIVLLLPKDKPNRTASLPNISETLQVVEGAGKGRLYSLSSFLLGDDEVKLLKGFPLLMPLVPERYAWLKELSDEMKARGEAEKFWSLLGVSWFSGGQSLLDEEEELGISLDEMQAFDIEGHRFYRYEKGFAPFTFSSSCVVVKGDGEIKEEVAERLAKGSKRIVVSAENLRSFCKKRALSKGVQRGVFRNISYKSGDVQGEVKSSEAGIVSLKEVYYPGWRVKVDEEEKPLLQVDGAFIGVKVPQGSHRVHFYYSPSWWRVSVAVSFASFLIGLLLLLYSFFPSPQLRRKGVSQ